LGSAEFLQSFLECREQTISVQAGAESNTDTTFASMGARAVTDENAALPHLLDEL